MEVFTDSFYWSWMFASSFFIGVFMDIFKASKESIGETIVTYWASNVILWIGCVIRWCYHNG